MIGPIPEEVTALLKVRVNNDLELRDTGSWILSVSVYKALSFQEERIAALTAELREAKQAAEDYKRGLAAHAEEANKLEAENATLRATVERLKAPILAPACIENEGFWTALNHFNQVHAARVKEPQ